MRKCTVICAILFLYFSAQAQQNIIINGGFENHVSCMLSHVDDSPPWQGSFCLPTLFDTCAFSPQSGVPKNLDSLLGYQLPHSGSSYAGIGLFLSAATVREYLIYPLNGELVSGKTYCLKFYVNLLNFSRYGVDGIGAYFSNQLLACTPNCLCVLNYQPQVKNPDGNIILDTLGWTEISGCYTATGMENFLTIGNFKPDSLTQFDTNRYVPSINWGTAYYIDDISLVEDSTSGINDVGNEKEYSLSPNPAQNFVTIKSPKYESIKLFKMISPTGETVLKLKDLKTKIIDLTSYSKGIYFYQIEFSSRKIISGKIILLE